MGIGSGCDSGIGRRRGALIDRSRRHHSALGVAITSSAPGWIECRLTSLAVIGVILIALIGAPTPASGAASMCFGMAATIVGTAENDQLRGTPSADTIVGLGGDDEIDGRGGDDRICSGDGNDLVRGGPGDDRIAGQVGTDVIVFDDAKRSVDADLEAGAARGQGADVLRSLEGIRGSPFADVLTGGPGAESLFGDDGNDTLVGAGGTDSLSGARGGDVLRGGPDDDLLDGGVGNDVIDGGSGVDATYYQLAPRSVSVNLATGEAVGNGRDSLLRLEAVLGSEFDDSITGDEMGNILVGGLGDDLIDGKAGLDALQGNAGDDLLRGGLGFDVASYATAPGAVDADLVAGSALGDGNDLLTSIEGVNGSIFDDVLLGDDQRNLFLGGFGNDVIDGGAGVDTLVFVFAAGPVQADLGAGTASGDGDDAIAGIEELYGSDFGDVLSGDQGDNVLVGRGGDDTLDGREGADALDGGGGADTCLNGEELMSCEVASALPGHSLQLPTPRSLLTSLALLKGLASVATLGPGAAPFVRRIVG